MDNTALVQEVTVDLGAVEGTVRHLNLDEVTLQIIYHDKGDSDISQMFEMGLQMNSLRWGNHTTGSVENPYGQ